MGQFCCFWSFLFFFLAISAFGNSYLKKIVKLVFNIYGRTGCLLGTVHAFLLSITADLSPWHPSVCLPVCLPACPPIYLLSSFLPSFLLPFSFFCCWTGAMTQWFKAYVAFVITQILFFLALQNE